MHDLRLPLANLLHYSSLACRRNQDTQWQVMQQESQRLKQLVEELNSRLFDPFFSADDQQLTPVSPQQQIERMVRCCQQRLQQSGVTLVTRLQGEQRLPYPPEQLNRILHNLLDNCARHAPGSQVILSCQQQRREQLTIRLECRFQQPAVKATRQGLPSWWRLLRPSLCGIGLRSCRRRAAQQRWGWHTRLDSQGFEATLQLPLSSEALSDRAGVLRV